MKLPEALKHASRFAYSPEFTVYRTSGTGEYTTLLNTSNADDVVNRFSDLCRDIRYPDGIEVRCNGVLVQFD